MEQIKNLKKSLDKPSNLCYNSIIKRKENKKMFCEKGKKHCLCADCVRNIYYAENTPHPCSWADCDICIGDAETFVCNQYLNLEELNKKVEKEKKKSLTD